MNQEINKTNYSSRNPIIAFILSLFLTGSGQMYNGQIVKGSVFLAVELLLPVFFGFTRLTLFFGGFVAYILVGIFFKIYVVYDATKTARRLKNFTPEFYHKWYYFIGIIAAIYLAVWFYDTSSIVGAKSYKIPSTANEPTLRVDDRIIADLKAFDHAKPNYGDIIVFQKRDSLNPWLYRIVGLPNDKLEIQNNFLTINGNECKTSFVGKTMSGHYEVLEYIEELPNGHKHRIYTFANPVNTNTKAIKKIKIPENSYFVMGDNRDNAEDSRYIGIITEDEIVGKVVYSYWGKTNDRIAVDFKDK